MYKAGNKGIPGIRDKLFCHQTTQYQSQGFRQTTIDEDLQKYANCFCANSGSMYCVLWERACKPTLMQCWVSIGLLLQSFRLVGCSFKKLFNQCFINTTLSESELYRQQILMSKADPRAVRDNLGDFPRKLGASAQCCFNVESRVG